MCMHTYVHTYIHIICMLVSEYLLHVHTHLNPLCLCLAESKHSRRMSSPLQTSQSTSQPKAAVYTFPSSQQTTSLAQVVDRKDCARVPVRSRSGRRIAQDYSQTQTKYHQFQRHGEAAKQTSLSSKENTCSPTGANWTVEGVLNQMGGAKSTMPYLGLRQFNRHYVPVTSGDSWQHFSKYQAQQGHQRGRYVCTYVHTYSCVCVFIYVYVCVCVYI